MRLLNFGSLNIDYVYRMASIVTPGETLASRSLDVFAGGKGANQSVALARAGAEVHHAGKVGPDGRWLRDTLERNGVDIEHTIIDESARTGHAVIQVDDAGENAIVLFPGTNHQMDPEHIRGTLDRFGADDLLLLQNEINRIDELIMEAKRRDLTVCLNPAPWSPQAASLPLDRVDVMIVNETEARGLAGVDDVEALLAQPSQFGLGHTHLIVTRGRRGVSYRRGDHRIDIDACPVEPVDTTAAGDTFIGYCLAAWYRGDSIDASLRRATTAAAICVGRAGAIDSIPESWEVA